MDSIYIELIKALIALIFIGCLAGGQWLFVQYEENPVKYYGPPAMFFFMLDCIYILSGKSKYYFSLDDEKETVVVPVIQPIRVESNQVPVVQPIRVVPVGQSNQVPIRQSNQEPIRQPAPINNARATHFDDLTSASDISSCFVM